MFWFPGNSEKLGGKIIYGRIKNIIFNFFLWGVVVGEGGK